MNSKSFSTTRTSLSAVISLVFGIMSPIVLFTVLPTVLTSLLAIGLGHTALVKIGRSNASLLGRGRAIAGLILGYVFLPISLISTPGYLYNFPDATNFTAKKRSLFDAGSLIAHSSGGNSPDAKRLAVEYSRKFEEIINSVIVEKTRSGDQENLNDKFNVFCQLSPGRICFLVKVPGYHKYEDNAREVLADAAWKTGVATTADATLPPGTINMAIGLKGRILFGNIMRGKVDWDQPAVRDLSSELLEEYFE